MDLDLYSQMQYNKSQADCIGEALQTLQGLDADDLKNFIEEVQTNAELKGISIEKSVKQQTSELATVLQNRLYRLNKQYETLFNPKEGLFNKIKDKELELRDTLTNNTLKNRGQNVENSIRASQVRLRQNFLAPLEKENQERLVSGKFDSSIADYLDTGKAQSEFIRDIGDRMKSLVSDIKTELVQSTAMGIEDLNKYRKFSVTYDHMRLQKLPSLLTRLNRLRKGLPMRTMSNQEAKSLFIDKMKKRANLKAMFGLNAGDDAVVNEAFSEMYDRILRAGKIIKQGLETVTDKPEIAKRRRMFVVWKDWKSYVEHSQEYGTGNGTLYEQAMSDINSSGRRSGLAKTFGADYNWGFNQLRKAALDSGQKERLLRNPVNTYRNLTGEAGVPYHPQVAQIQANFNAYIGTVRQLPLSIISLNDTNFGLSSLSSITKTNEWQNFATKAKAIASMYKTQLTKGEVDPVLKKVLDNSFYGLQHDVGAQIRFVDHQDMGSMTRKVTDKFYSWNGMASKDTGNRAGAMYIASKALGDNKDIPWENLNEYLKKRLESFNFTEPEWDILRKYSSDYGEQGHLIAADNVNDIPEYQIKSLAKTLNKTSDDTRNDLYAKVFGWLDTVANETVLTPGAEEKAMLYLGTQPGTLPGVMLRAFGQFKGFLLSYINRILINGIKDPASTKFRWAITNFMYTLPLTMAGNIFYNISHDRPVKWDPRDWGLNDWVDTMVPGMGIFTKVLDPRNENTSAILSLLQSPSLGAMSDLISTGASGINLATGALGKAAGQKVDLNKKVKDVKSKASKVAYDFTPLNSVPYLAPWWRQHMISTKK